LEKVLLVSVCESGDLKCAKSLRVVHLWVPKVRIVWCCVESVVKSELKVVSVILFLCLGLFILLSFVQLTFDGRFNAAPHDSDLWYPKMDDPETLGAL
jgi:hypothetical protein